MSDVIVENKEDIMNEPEIKKTVSYESHQKLLDETKKAKVKAQELENKLSEFQAKSEKEETDKLLEQRKYQELAFKLEKENSLLKEKMDKENARIQQIVKTKAIKAKLTDINEVYLSKFAKFDDIVVNDEGEVDEDSVDYVVQKFKQEHPVFFTNKQEVKAPSYKVATNNKPLFSHSDVKGMNSKEILEILRKK